MSEGQLQEFCEICAALAQVGVLRVPLAKCCHITQLRCFTSVPLPWLDAQNS